MLSFILKKFAGRHHRKYIEKCRPIVTRINEFELQYQPLTDDQLRAKTDEFRARLKQGETLDQILPEAFAVVKNGARRLCGRKISVCDHELTWDMVHFDVQLIGGMTLHEGRIAEMATGEGKTLVATLPLYLNALTGKNAQLVTVNDYLARRDSEWMGHLYSFLGITVGCIQQQMHSEVRREMYTRGITYGTASEFGFDYLRDNGMATRKEDQVQRDHFYCIVDEIDSILVDEARTPLIISGPAPIEREQPFMRLKPGVEELVSAQLRLINKLVKEAVDLLEKKDVTPEERSAAAMKMLQVKLGMPKNKLLLRLQENPEWRKLLDKTDVEMHSDFNKDELYRYKEELFFVIDEKNHQADLTEPGRTRLRPADADAFVLPDLATRFIDIEKDTALTPEQKEQAKRESQQRYEVVSEDIHALSQLLRAYALYERDVEYVVQEGKVVIVDENTGRIMSGRRWSDGLHQAVEAKEAVTIERETRTYATVTIQNYFRMYEKLAGMTGTAETEATEFHEIYRLSVTQIPTNQPCIRLDRNDSIFKTRRDNYGAVVKQIQEAQARGQPVLVGTVTVEQSEVLSRMLKRAGVIHTVLNAKFHQQEAEIITRAGQRGSVTIATNMAGRGTDIKLGEGVRELGGLLVVGTERHESRRIDRQLRGRCSRQGDPGATKFFLSLEDDLMRLFLQGNLASRIMEGAMNEGEELEHPWLNRSIESAQKKVEQLDFLINPYSTPPAGHQRDWLPDDWDPALRFWSRPYDRHLTEWLYSVDANAPSIIAAREFGAQPELWHPDKGATPEIWQWIAAEDLKWRVTSEGWSRVRTELEQLKIYMVDDRANYLDEADAQADDIPGYMIHFIGANGRDHPWTIELIRCGLAIGNITYMSYKAHYNRVRPSVLCPGLTPPFGPPMHPAFPSGHSFLAHFIALLLLELPDLRARLGVLPASQQANSGKPLRRPVWTDLSGHAPINSPLFTLARRIAVNRERIGVHYPSDTFAGRHLAAGIWDAIMGRRGPHENAAYWGQGGHGIKCSMLSTILRRAKTEWPER